MIPPEDIEEIAKHGKDSLDLAVSDIVGGKIGIMPASATASNFGKARRSVHAAREDVALSILKMVMNIA